MINILGISAFYHDSAAALIQDGEIIAAAQEERFSRIKHDERFPQNAIKYVLKEGNVKLNGLIKEEWMNLYLQFLKKKLDEK